MYKLRPKLVVKRYYRRYEERGSAGSHHLGVCRPKIPFNKPIKLPYPTQIWASTRPSCMLINNNAHVNIR